MVKYSKEVIDKCYKLYVEKRKKISEIAAMDFAPAKKTLYRWKDDYNWDEQLKEKAKTMYLEERQKLPDIARALRKSVNTIKQWKKNGEWDKEIFIIGNIGLSRELNNQFVQEVRTALKEKRLTDPKTADKLSKLLKVIEKLTPDRIRLANIYMLLKDLTDFVTQIGDEVFLKKYQKYLPEISDHLREKYE